MFHASGLLVVLIKARMLFAIERFLFVCHFEQGHDGQLSFFHHRGRGYVIC